MKTKKSKVKRPAAIRLPRKWSEAELSKQSLVSIAAFRQERLAEGSGEWDTHVKAARAKFTALFNQVSELAPGGITNASLSKVYGSNLGEALRYLAGPPISADDLKILGDIESGAAKVLKSNPAELRKVFRVIQRTLDAHRFPRVSKKRRPSKEEKEAALLASSVLLAAQSIATKRRNAGKSEQEKLVKEFLKQLKFKQVATRHITTLMEGPGVGEFCGECKLGDRKADIVLRLHDTRLMPIECKVSNSYTNSVKRLNNDAAVKARSWTEKFGTDQVVPSAVVSGVFNVLNLIQAQESGLAIFWGHDLTKLGNFIKTTSRKRR